jgi:solute carrier family 29 (equilibrative nucleoside transporter), member 1/2/3
VWNTGDLLGRLSTLHRPLHLRPRFLLLLALARLLFIPLYLLCNIDGAGARVPSDLFYLAVVQLLFGASNGYLGSVCMMAAAGAVEVQEKEAAGGFMGLCLVAGLTVGSLLSFVVAGV